MSSHAEKAFELFQADVGNDEGTGEWFEVAQDQVNQFADVTHDHQFIHVDPEAAKATPFGTTIAHGFLTLSLLSAFGREALPPIAGRRMGVNYGFDRVRFVSPVRSGARVRGRFALGGLEHRQPGELMLRYAVTVEIEGGSRPALIADWLTLAILD